MIRFFLTLNDAMLAFPFQNFESMHDCAVSAHNLIQLFWGGGESPHYKIECVDQITGDYRSWEYGVRSKGAP